MSTSPGVTDRRETVAQVLTEAFTGDPLMSWLFNDAETHVSNLATWWGSLTSHLPEGGELWLAGDNSSAAIWHRPRFSDADEGSEEAVDEHQAEPNPFLEMLQPMLGNRLTMVLEMFSSILQAHPAEPHWYLPAVGTRPSMQGRGSGAAMLRPVLDRCDQQGLPAYLESSNPRNLAFYHRLGFVETGEIVTPDQAASVTTMWRPGPNGPLRSSLNGR